jgi:hypothetical protein
MDEHPTGLKFSLYFNFLKGNAKVPQMPETSLRLRELLASERASLEQVTRLLHSNPPLPPTCCSSPKARCCAAADRESACRK